jgi:hypothetical protein
LPTAMQQQHRCGIWWSCRIGDQPQITGTLELNAFDACDENNSP